MLRALRSREFRQNAAAQEHAFNLDRWLVSDDEEEKQPRFLGERAAQRWDQARAGQDHPTARPPPEGRGFFGRALSAGAAGLGALGRALNVPADYTLRPFAAIVGGLTEAERRELLDEQGRPTGQFYREQPGFNRQRLGLIGQSLAEFARDPAGQFREGQEAFREFERNPGLNVVQRALLSAGTDPLGFVGPGLARQGVRAVGLTGIPARVGRELLDAGGPGVVVGGQLGAEAEREYGEDIAGWNRLPPEVRGLVAALGGGVGGGLATARLRRRGLEGIPGAQQGFGLGLEDVTKTPGRLGHRTAVQSSRYPELEYEFRYRVVELDDLVVSHDPFNFDPVPFYNQRIQPRQRDRAASRLQVEEIERKLDPRRMLAETGDLQTGTPIIGPDGLVESGNARTMGAFRAAHEGSERWTRYQEELRRRLPEYGIDPAVTTEMRKPFLVRERLTDVDRQLFADEANASPVLRMGAREAAAVDERLISDGLLHSIRVSEATSIDAMIGSEQGSRMVMHFMNQIPAAERGALMDAKGNLTSAGVARVRAALFAKTYEDEAGRRLLTEFLESREPVIRNVRNALEDSLPSIARLEAGIRLGRIDPNLSISRDVAVAADTFRRSRTGALQFHTVDEYLRQAATTDEAANLGPLATDMLRFMDKNRRSGKAIREALQRYALQADQLPPAGQTGLFGEVAPTRDAVSLWQEATGRPGEIVTPLETATPGAPAVAAAGDPAAAWGPLPTARPVPETTPQPLPEAPLAGTAPGPEALPALDEPLPTARPIQMATPQPGAGAWPEDVPPGGWPADRWGRQPRLGTGELPRVGPPPDAHTVIRIPEATGRDIPPQQRRLTADEAQALKKAEQRPPPDGGPVGPDTHEWWPAWLSAWGGQIRHGDWTAGPPPPGGGPRFKHFEPGERFDLFQAMSRNEEIAAADAYLRSFRGRANQFFRGIVRRFGGAHLDPNLTLDLVVRPFVVGNKVRTDGIIDSFVAEARERGSRAVRQAGIVVRKMEDGAYRINGDPNMPTLEDVIEMSTPEGRAFREALTPEQQKALARIEWSNEAINKTILAHGGELPWDPRIEGTYFPRKVIAIGGRERTSGASGFKHPRTMETLEEGLRRGVTYDDPWDAFEAGLRGKLRYAQDLYLRSMLVDLAAKPADNAVEGFGWAKVKNPAFGDLLFEQTVADRINAALEPSGENIFTKVPTSVNSYLTPLRATGDLSASFQQGMVAWINNPKVAARMWLATTASLKNSEHYFRLLDAMDAKGPGFVQHIRWGGRYVSPDSVDEFLMPKLAAKISDGRLKEFPIVGPIVRGSNQHFARFLNLVRLEMGNQAWERALGLGLEGKALDKHMRAAWNSINRATGWTARQPTTLERLLIFAPRYTSASVEQVWAALTRGGIEGAIARRHLIRLLVANAAVAWMWNEATGHETDPDPTSTNWLRMRNVAGLDITMLGTYNTLFRMIAGVMVGDDRVNSLHRFGWAKLSPAAKLLYEPFVTQATFLGRPQDPTTFAGFAATAREQVFASLPFTVQNLREEGPLAGLIGGTGITSTPVTPAEKRDFARDRVARERFGLPYAELAAADKSRINEDPEVALHQAEASRRVMDRAGQAAVYETVRVHAQAQLEALSEEFEQGQIDGREFRRQHATIQAELRGARQVLDPDRRAQDPVIEGWFALYDAARLPSGRIDTQQLEALQNDYTARFPDVHEQLDRMIGVGDNETLRQLREARKLASQYYDIPAFRGMSVEDAEVARRIIQQATDMVAFGFARDRQHALGLLGAETPQGVRLARIALLRGPNPLRRQFRRDPRNRLFAKFYGPAGVD